MNKPSMPHIKWLDDFNPATASTEFKDFIAIQTEEDLESVGIKPHRSWLFNMISKLKQWFNAY